MTDRTHPPFRADHVGSLLRPAELAEARDKAKRGEISPEQCRAVEDACIREAVQMQQAVGLRAVTDGEFRRDWWHFDFQCGFDGVELRDETFGTEFSSGLPIPSTYVAGKVAYPAGGIMTDHLRFVLSAATVTAKFCVPAPALLHFRGGREGISEQAYPDLAEFWADIGTAYNAAVIDLASQGCTYLQIDETSYCHLCDPEKRAMAAARGDDPDRLLDTYIAVNNAAIAGRPAGLTVTMHMCRGNFQSTWMSQGGYEEVAEKILSLTEVDGFFMEYDSDRAGDFRPLRFLPPDRFVVLGLVTTKQPELESKDELKRRIDEAAQYVPLNQLCLSPQCGFASSHHGNKLTHDDQRRKLDRVIEVANEVWGST